MKALYIKPQTIVVNVDTQTVLNAVSFTNDMVNTEDAYSKSRLWDEEEEDLYY